MGIRATLSGLVRRTTVLLAVVPVAVAVAQPLEAHASVASYTFASADGDCTMTVNYDPGDPKGSAQTILSTSGMSCATSHEEIAYEMYDWRGDVSGVAVPVPVYVNFGASCAAGQQSSNNVFSVKSLPGSSCWAPEMAGVHTIEVEMQIEITTDKYVDSQTYFDVVVP